MYLRDVLPRNMWLSNMWLGNKEMIKSFVQGMAVRGIGVIQEWAQCTHAWRQNKQAIVDTRLRASFQ